MATCGVHRRISSRTLEVQAFRSSWVESALEGLEDGGKIDRHALDGFFDWRCVSKSDGRQPPGFAGL